MVHNILNKPLFALENKEIFTGIFAIYFLTPFGQLRLSPRDDFTFNEIPPVLKEICIFYVLTAENKLKTCYVQRLNGDFILRMKFLVVINRKISRNVTALA